MKKFVRNLLVAGAVGGVSLLAAGVTESRANIVPTLESISSENGDFRWTYAAHIGGQHRVETDDFFTIYDFHGFVPGSNQEPEGWDFVAMNVGQTPDRVLVNDSPTVVNLTWIRVGDTTGDGGSFNLGAFSAVSTMGQAMLGSWTSRSTKENAAFPIEDGTKTDNVGSVAVPIPLPAAVFMFPLGLAVAGVCYRRMRR